MSSPSVLPRPPSPELVGRIADLLAAANALVIGAGAGMGVDSGLPDFRGPEGFWQAYPPYRALGLQFSALANPRWFVDDPELAWGFYGHRLELYRRTVPHEGFAVLRRLAERMEHGAFVYTSNVDGQFQRAGFDPERIFEVHGAIDFVQCTRSCGGGIEPADGWSIEVDPATFRARGPLPTCRCGALLRPNILMFGDGGWDDARSSEQGQRFARWLRRIEASKGRIVVIECGAGTAISTVRDESERLACGPRTSLVRINVREPAVPDGRHVGLSCGAKMGLLAIEQALVARG